MAVIQVTQTSVSLTGNGTTGGYVTVANNALFPVGAIVYLYSAGAGTAECVVTDLGTSAGQVGLRFTSVKGNGRSDVSAWTTAGSAILSMPAQLVNATPFSTGGSLTVTAGAGAGTGPTLTCAGNDDSGLLTVITGTLPTGSNAVVATVFFALPRAAVPRSIVISPANAATALLSGATEAYTDSANATTASWVLSSGSSALTASTTYKWYYRVTF